MFVWLRAPGWDLGDPRPGFLTCHQKFTSTLPLCGVDDDAAARLPTFGPDRSPAWVFSPFPDQTAQLVQLPAAAGPITIDPAVDPAIACLEAKTERWAFHLVTNKYTQGCPPPF
jgi:hypothetical protein